MRTDEAVNLDYAKRAKETYLSTKPQGMEAEKRVTLHIIENGAHGFSKKHDTIAMEYLKKFVTR